MLETTTWYAAFKRFFLLSDEIEWKVFFRSLFSELRYECVIKYSIFEIRLTEM